MKIRRSVLYVPGNKQRALESRRTLSADCIVYDLEDSVAPQAKDDARDGVLRVLSNVVESRPERIVRVNSLHSRWVEDDIVAMKHARVDAILLPKICSADDVQAYKKLMRDSAIEGIALWVMAETASAVLNLSEIVSADPTVEVVMMGLEDLATETGIRYTPSRSGFMYTLSAGILAARAHGVSIVDSVYVALDDEAGFVTECKQARELGFDGKSLIHPCQIDICNRCFSPSADEIRWAEEILFIWDGKKRNGRSVVVVNGRMVEHLHVRQARRILGLSELAITN